jgi:opacity protein-like surface antigen
MKRIAVAALLSTALALCAARSASAQPYAAPPPPPPAGPPAGAPGAVSQVGGTPVPVGDQHQYYYAYRRTNLSANPLGWIFGIYGVSLSHGLSDNFALRGDFNYFDFLGDDEGHGYELGVGLPIYFRRTYSGFFLEPGAIVRRYTDTGDLEEDGTTTVGPQVLIGWHWMWDSGLNFAIAAGVGRNWATEDTDSSHDDEELFGNGYLRFGYAF